MQQHEPFSTKETVAVMPGNQITIADVNAILFERHGNVYKRLIRNRVYNMTKSKYVVIEMETDGYVKTWRLISASPNYFRKSSHARQLRRGQPTITHHNVP